MADNKWNQRPKIWNYNNIIDPMHENQNSMQTSLLSLTKLFLFQIKGYGIGGEGEGGNYMQHNIICMHMHK